jgi:polysaccharide pyruvyl transferase WcaK-like protein
MGQYDLLINPGAGYMCDVDKRFLMPVFDRLEAAIARGIPTAMVGQGVGPLTDEELCARASEVLPHVDFIFIRENRIGRPLLESLGVPSAKIIMTGDDAIDLAYLARRDKVGDGLGVSLRISSYFATQAPHLAALRPVIQDAASRHNAELVEVPIQLYWNEADVKAIRVVTQGYRNVRPSPRRLATSAETIKQIGRCRVMISSTFHGAVLAVGQGIPVVALVKSVEYTDKLVGLAAEFGEKGCQVVNMNAPDAGDRLAEAVEFAWASADELRPALLANAKRQMDLGAEAYRKIYDLAEARRHRQVDTGK